ncbi:hypothetical protein Yalta_052 [Yalta virus]|nr:hypothetical protein Yalta_052 [Yalta virus]
MAYNRNIEEINQIHENVIKTQNMIYSLLEKYDKNGIKIKNEDIFLLKELQNKFKLDYNLILILLHINVMNYSRYLRSLDKNILTTKKEIQRYYNE